MSNTNSNTNQANPNNTNQNQCSTMCASCPYDSVIEELKRDSERNSNQHREFYNRFQAIETAQAVSDEKYNNLLSVLLEVKASVNELKEKPTKRWDSIITYAMTFVLGLVLSYLFSLAIK